ncbi:MAG: hypothetical protein M3O99_03765, partial [Chloroflexota bacterium]|nr:hypothetical protein [Chloroflexota bacterium]
MKRFAAILAVLALVPALGGGAQASSDNISPMYDYHISDAFIQSLGEPTQTGAQATATVGGDHVRVVGSGTFNTAAGRATGGGTFVHTNASDVLVGFGTWTATSLVSFTSYGCGIRGGEPVPANFCGGLATMKVHISATVVNPPIGAVETDATLVVDCKLGTPPTTAHEGIKLDGRPAAPNFDITNDSPHGET